MSLASLPITRTVDGPTGTSLKEINTFLRSIKDIPIIDGVSVAITFSATDVASSIVKRTITGLGHGVTGFFIYRGHTGSGLIQSNPPVTEIDTSVLYLRATIATTYFLWVF